MLKPGYRTSEFWLTVVSFVFSGLYLVGLLDDHSQKEDLIVETSRGVEAFILIIGQLTVLFRYIKGRSELKRLWWDTASPEESKVVNSRSKKNVNRNSKRTSKSRNRKTSNSSKTIPE